jgi:hypothetical protein
MNEKILDSLKKKKNEFLKSLEDLELEAGT